MLQIHFNTIANRQLNYITFIFPPRYLTTEIQYKYIISFPMSMYPARQRQHLKDVFPIRNILLEDYRKNGIDSFHAEWNKKPAKNPVKAKSNRTRYLLNDEDLAQMIIPSEQTHHLTKDLIRISGSKVEIRPSLMTFSKSKSLPRPQSIPWK